MKLQFKKLHPDAIIPRYATKGAACFDLHAICVEGSVKIQHGVTVATFRTGLAVEIPEGYAMMIYSRSGHGFKHGVRLSNCVGVIDADYRGELMVKLIQDENGSFTVNRWDRIAQAMIVPAPQVQLIEADELSDTERGTGGFGSTDA